MLFLHIWYELHITCSHPVILYQMKLLAISVESIVDGEDDVTLALVWNMILKFQVTRLTAEMKVLLANSLLCISYLHGLQWKFSSYAAQRKETSREGTPDISMEEVKQELKQWARKATEGYVCPSFCLPLCLSVCLLHVVCYISICSKIISLHLQLCQEVTHFCSEGALIHSHSI